MSGFQKTNNKNQLVFFLNKMLCRFVILWWKIALVTPTKKKGTQNHYQMYIHGPDYGTFTSQPTSKMQVIAGKWKRLHKLECSHWQNSRLYHNCDVYTCYQTRLSREIMTLIITL